MPTKESPSPELIQAPEAVAVALERPFSFTDLGSKAINTINKLPDVLKDNANKVIAIGTTALSLFGGVALAEQASPANNSTSATVTNGPFKGQLVTTSRKRD